MQGVVRHGTNMILGVLLGARTALTRPSTPQLIVLKFVFLPHRLEGLNSRVFKVGVVLPQAVLHGNHC